MDLLLPGDPPLQELGCALGILGTLVALTLSIVGRFQRNRWTSNPISTAVIGSAGLFLFCGTQVGLRNVGKWKELKSELQTFSRVVANYEIKAGRIDSETRLEEFIKSHPPVPFSFGPGKAAVWIVYLPRLEPPRVGIRWGKGRTASFDLHTMVCDYSD